MHADTHLASVSAVYLTPAVHEHIQIHGFIFGADIYVNFRFQKA